MPNIASALKSEISRIARKEVRAEAMAIRDSTTSHRSEIAQLKQRARSLEKMLGQLGRGKPPRPAVSAEENAGAQRYSAKRLLAHRKRLGLCASEVGLLLGTSGQSIYNWEQVKSKPRAGHLVAIAALRRLGKKEAAAVVSARAGTAYQSLDTGRPEL